MPLRLAAVLFAVCLTGAAWADGRTVVIAADPWCPYNCRPDSDHPGYMVEIARAAFEPLGYRVVYRTITWSRALRMAAEGRIDGAIGASPLEAHDSALVFSPGGLGNSVNTLLARQGTTWTYHGPGSLAGRVLGLIQDYDYGPVINEFAARHPHQVARLAGADALEKNLRKLLAGRLDAVVEDRNVVRHALARLNLTARTRDAGEVGVPNPVGIAFTDSTHGRTLAKTLQNAVPRLRRDGRLAAILARYGLTDWQAPATAAAPQARRTEPLTQ